MQECPEKLQEESDEKLAELVIQGNHTAFSLLVRRHSTKFYNLAFRILNSRDIAQDIVQECFLKFWHDATKFNTKNGVKFTTWFYRVVLNKCYDHNKKLREITLPQNFDIVDNNNSVDVIITKKTQEIIFQKAFLDLDTRQRTALSLCYFEEKKNAEAAKIMNLKLKAFQSLLLRSKENLRQNFIKLGGENV